MMNFPHKSLSLNSASGSDLLSLFSSRSKTDFDLKGRFLDAVDVSQFPGRKTVNMQAGRRTKHSGQNVCEMVLYRNVILSDFSVLTKMKFFKNFKFPAGSGARTSRRHRDRNTEAGCRHRPEEMAGDTAGDT
ncbi:unnamed protein product, partial [Staurois parvus]